MENNQEIDELSNDSVEDEILEKGDEEEETTPNKKNKSNFNGLYKKAKELENSINEKDKLLLEKEAELEDWRKLNPEVEEKNQDKKKSDNLELKVFGLENPEAKPHLEAIKTTMSEYGVSYAKAWKLVKVDLPKESTTKTDFNIGKSNIVVKDLSKVSPEDALSLSKEQKREWRKLNGMG